MAPGVRSPARVEAMGWVDEVRTMIGLVGNWVLTKEEVVLLMMV